MLRIICVWQICGGSNRVFSHCISHENVVQAWHEVKAAWMVSKICLPVNFWSGGWLAIHPPHVALGWIHCYHLPPLHFHILHISNYCWWATGNFCVGYGCSLPCLWNIAHILVSLDRVAIPPHAACSLTCSEFCVCPWRQWHRPGLCLSSSGTQPCYIYYNFACGTKFLSAETGQPSSEPT